jgi:uncharacterized protein (TIGR02246 family)
MPSPEAAKAEVAAVTRAWAEALNRCDPARISALYDREAVLWATGSVNITSTPEGVRKYFDGVCASPTPPKVEFGEQLIRVHGDTASNSGSYTFIVTREGKPVPIPARYSLAYRKTGGQWLIVDHHSSVRPAPPKP